MSQNPPRRRVLNKITSPQPQSPSLFSASEQETENEKDIDFVETEQEEDVDDGILQSDWGNEPKEQEDVQEIPLDHDVHGQMYNSTMIAFGQQFLSGKVITTKELVDMKERILSSGQRLEKIPLWLDVSPPTDECANSLEEVFGLHPLTIDDWFTPDTREKAAFFENYFEISVVEMRYMENTNILNTYLLNIVIKKNVIITVHSEPIAAVNDVRIKIKDKYKGTFPSAHWVLYAILELIISNFNLLNERLYSDVYNIEQLSLVLLRDDQDEFLGRIGDLKKRASLLQFLVSPKKSFLRFILKSKSNMVSKNLKIYLRDILDDTVRLLEKLSSLTHSIENHQETYLAKISLSVNRYSEEENLLMKKFGAIATLFLPMSFIAALFGMNVTVPGQDNPSLVWFFVILSLCLVWMIVGVIFFKIYKWF
ncbi:magnesium/cobalt transport protein CorA, putative [Entamoeba histolytica HM-1:IMSS-B]|uniref:Magnesium and cobalt transport protein CorA, putative n=6 Tax=Entamoeba histolytica TaxID=5759 RepID=C4LWJ3_ENTH1|nr:magnesium and cobalt transport protein CorA, putative [Entamoeba histolytica HM-1:IMSS]EMD45736.1 magnesium and cobalt transport protein CorA, putative [Entamoeba histolytica KU27]EMH73929.1 magnesium/cobalt transport protein CorA, putative [Entamoeba histolytica HM-1:IMSS-B]EMS17872.1 magnesium and cobalt transport protein CorA, putative [Entamoeba histolytica HM-3:IMSS]ENY60190.1 magnesium and cobalt transport protein CorA, putative [Entamoeba histolytica HM-1:IMSS-A]GAT93081.1 magnesium |eukprot:XP_655666.2 magnesium and cobalt transport protein CorA, putative [Entamoeba histolytica HM-1:IMSS]